MNILPTPNKEQKMPSNNEADEKIWDLIGSCVIGREWVATGDPENFEAAEISTTHLYEKIKERDRQLLEAILEEETTVLQGMSVIDVVPVAHIKKLLTEEG